MIDLLVSGRASAGRATAEVSRRGCERKPKRAASCRPGLIAGKGTCIYAGDIVSRKVTLMAKAKEEAEATHAYLLAEWSYEARQCLGVQSYPGSK